MYPISPSPPEPLIVFMTPASWATAIWLPCRGKIEVRPALPPLKGRHSDGYCLSIHSVNCAVAPEPSERTTGLIVSDGSAWPPFSLVISGSAQLVILLVKILVIVSPDSRRLVTRWPATVRW